MTEPGSTHRRLTPLLDAAIPLSDKVRAAAPPLLAECERLLGDAKAAVIGFAICSATALTVAFSWAVDWPFGSLWLVVAAFSSCRLVVTVHMAIALRAAAEMLLHIDLDDERAAAMVRQFLDEYR